MSVKFESEPVKTSTERLFPKLAVFTYSEILNLSQKFMDEGFIAIELDQNHSLTLKLKYSEA
jgi:hypothetical protein